MKLASAGFSIISGLARGTDTIAVFVCGLGHTYPPENIKLKQQIVEQGAIVSESLIYEARQE